MLIALAERVGKALGIRAIQESADLDGVPLRRR
jgi:hypothetical protein